MISFLVVTAVVRKVPLADALDPHEVDIVSDDFLTAERADAQLYFFHDLLLYR
jgi:hypothetical protein